MFVSSVLWVELELSTLSSNNMRIAGVRSSSNCPFFAAHRKAIKNPPATTMLIPISKKIALIDPTSAKF